LLKALEGGGVLKIIERGSGRKPSTYIFPKLLKIID
jgi:hypothetical protein